VWFAHGDSDEVVLPAWGRGSFETVQGMGLERAEFHTYRHVAHESSPQELADLAVWLGSVLPSAAKKQAVSAAASSEALAQGLLETPKITER
jgi:hypothetical protein